jgi:hypothetical protein
VGDDNVMRDRRFPIIGDVRTHAMWYVEELV